MTSSEKDFKITKLKEYDGDNESEKIFFDGLFTGRYNSGRVTDSNRLYEIMKKTKENGEKISYAEALKILDIENSGKRDYVTGSDLYNKFYITLYKIKKKINSKENRSKIFENLVNSKVKYLIGMIVVILILIMAIPMFNNGGGIDDLLSTSIFYLLGLAVMLGGIISKKNTISNLIFGIVFGGTVVFPVMVMYMLQDAMYIVTGSVGIISISVLMVFLNIMPKRTPYGNKMLGKLRGFKRFLETAEKEQLEALVNEEPEYFYSILPYTYALGVSDVWMNQFETISMQAPKWYVGHGIFNIHEFNSFVNHTMKSAQSAMSSSPSSKSGGGSSGGGSGGGGGGSW